ACKNGASCHRKFPISCDSSGTSEPNKSMRSVCSDKLILVRFTPTTFARFVISAVLPTPGFPSSRIGLFTCIALIVL
ncbi:hypothetical protein CANCADRAFT_14590, partial [Tortispora caseinolytica NRRL Y-17796]